MKVKDLLRLLAGVDGDCQVRIGYDDIRVEIEGLELDVPPHVEPGIAKFMVGNTLACQRVRQWSWDFYSERMKLGSHIGNGLYALTTPLEKDTST